MSHYKSCQTQQGPIHFIFLCDLFTAVCTFIQVIQFFQQAVYTGLLLFSIGNHGVGFCQINCGAVDLWEWDNSCAWIPLTHLSAALQIGSDVGVRSLCMEVE